MNITIESKPALSSIKFPPFVPTAGERETIKAVSAELDRIDKALDDVASIRAVIQSAADAFATGEMGIAEAVTLVSIDDAADRAEVKVALSRALKARARAVVVDASPVVRRWQAGRVAYLADLARTMEASERDAGEAVGIGADSFQPSATLASLRETHRRHIEAGRQDVTREDFRVMLRETDIDALEAPSPRRKRQPAEQAEEVSTDDPAAELAKDFH